MDDEIKLDSTLKNEELLIEQARLRDLPLKLTSKHALKRSISAKYPNLTPDQLDETFEQMKGHIGWKKKTDESGFTVWVTPSGETF